MAGAMSAPTIQSQTALRYAALGWAVVPMHSPVNGACSCHDAACKSPAKHPRTMHGVHDASTDPEVIDRWFRMWPGSNIGIATGKVSGLIILDVDPRNGGGDSLAALLAEHGPLPACPTAISGSGGRHYYFQYVATRLPKELAPGLDLLSDGLLVVAPYSEHLSGARYAWERAPW
jgi:hypothetical protein